MLTFCLYVTLLQTFCYTVEPVKNYKIDTNQVIERSTKMIIKYEWLSLTAYPDVRINGVTLYSIWYGTRSFFGEVITKQEAWHRMRKIITQSVDTVKRDFPNASENELIALTSLFYNCWNWYKKVKKHWYEVWLYEWFCDMAWYSGLTKRRNEEKYLLWFNIE